LDASKEDLIQILKSKEEEVRKLQQQKKDQELNQERERLELEKWKNKMNEVLEKTVLEREAARNDFKVQNKKRKKKKKKGKKIKKTHTQIN
jgi:hypothetical protein